MEFKYIIYAILVVAIIIGFFFFSNYDIDDLIPGGSKKLVISHFEVSSDEIGVNESFSISVEAEGKGIALINYSSLNKKETFDCGGKDSCKAEFSDVFASAGTYQIKAEVVDRENTQNEQKKTIRVIRREKTCIDETEFNGCSSDLPKFCDQGLLEDRCSVCGCAEKHFCFNESCIARAGSLSIEKIESAGFNIVKTGSAFSIRVILKNSEERIAAGATYLLDLNIIDSNGKVYLSCSKRFSLANDLQKLDELDVIIERNSAGEKIKLGKEGSYDASVTLYGIVEDENYSSFDSVTTEDFVSASADETASAPPSGLRAEKTAEGVLLSWSPNSEADLAGYNIYESITIDPAYISYGFRETVGADKNSIEILGLENKKYYFVITAVDFLGYESEYSEPATVDLSCPICGG